VIFDKFVKNERLVIINILMLVEETRECEDVMSSRFTNTIRLIYCIKKVTKVTFADAIDSSLVCILLDK